MAGREVLVPPPPRLATRKVAGPQGRKSSEGLLVLSDTSLSCFGGQRQGQDPDIPPFFQLPALLRPPEPLPAPHVLLQGLGLLLGGGLMLTIALLEEQLWPLVSEG